MKQQDIIFNNDEFANHKITVTIYAEQSEYISIIDSLLQAITTAEHESDRYYIGKIIRAMLPSEEQLESLKSKV